MPEGSTEDFVIEVPKGHYLPVFTPRIANSPPAQADSNKSKTEQIEQSLGLSLTSEKTAQSFRIPRWSLLSIVIAVLAGLAFAAVWFSRAKPATSGDPLETFWRSFFDREPPLVIYSNAPFVMDKTMELVQLPPESNSDQAIYDDYTGTGEAVGVFQLTRLFDAHRATFILKRSRLVTWDEARTRNLIFIGSTAQNLTLRDLPDTTEFSFASTPESPQKFIGILNRHPKSGEQKLYLHSDLRPLQSDFAIVALLPGVQPGHRILVLSGMTTYGTQAAVEYICRSDSVAELLHSVPSPNGQMGSFEAILETNIRGGVPLQARLIAIHAR